MQSNLWHRLPAHLIEFMLRKLPFENLVQLRVVCKEWNSFIVGSESRSPCARPRNVLLSIAANGSSLTSYNTSGKVWYNMSLSFLGVDPLLFKLVASDGGLLCFQNAHESGTFIICNPLIRRRKQLPSLPAKQNLPVWNVGGLVTDKKNGSYELIVVGSFSMEKGSCHEVTRTYESARGAWTKGNVLKVNCESTFASFPRGKETSSNGCLYAMALYKNAVMDDWGLRKYDIDKRCWSGIPVPAGISHPDVFEYDGEIYLSAQCCESILGPELHIWRLDKSEKVWSQGKSIFRDLCVVFSPIPDGCLCVCLGQKNSLSVAGLNSAGLVNVWIQDMTTETWGCLPPVDAEKFVPQVACIFQPSLSARV